jgi:SAM-dependent methyltransferase
VKNLSYYRETADLYDELVPRDINGICDSVTEIAARYTPCKDMLDLGCGTGRFTVALAKRGYKMIGMDITAEMLKIARINADKARMKMRFTKGDMRNFRLRKRTGIIWARGSIGDLLEVDDVKKAFRNIRNNLLKKGIFILDVRDRSFYLQKFRDGLRSENRSYKRGKRHTTFNFSARLDKKTGIEKMTGEIKVDTGGSIRKFKIHHALRYYTRSGVTRLLKDAGFKILEINDGYALDKKEKPHLVIVAKT